MKVPPSAVPTMLLNPGCAPSIMFAASLQWSLKKNIAFFNGHIATYMVIYISPLVASVQLEFLNSIEIYNQTMSETRPWLSISGSMMYLSIYIYSSSIGR